MLVVEGILHALRTDTVCTKRDIYYRNTKLFKKQTAVQQHLKSISESLKCSIDALHVAILIPPIESLEQVQTNAIALLVAEKDAVFQIICQNYEKICESIGGPLLLATGKGFPCKSTLHLLSKVTSIPILCLVDLDPYGILIFNNYRKYIPSIRYLGVKPFDLERYCLFDHLNSSNDLSGRDLKIVGNLSENHTPEIEPSVTFLREQRKKFEIQVLYETALRSQSSFLEDYLVTEIRLHLFQQK